MCECSDGCGCTERRLSVVAPDDDDVLVVHAPGSQVALLPGNEYLAATVIAAMIRENDHVSYLVVFWGSNGRAEEWVSASEVHVVDGGQKQAIGFLSRDKSKEMP